MSKLERDFHKLIAKQNSEQNDKLWEERIKDNIPQFESNNRANNGNTAALKIKFAVIPAVLTFAVALILILLFVFKPWVKEDSIRYRSSVDYTVNSTEQTLKDYSVQEGKELLYFDWYEETEYYVDKLYQLNSNQEIICFAEELVDINTGCVIRIWVTDNLTEMDFIKPIKESCVEIRYINAVNVYWKVSDFKGYGYFEYNLYCYCLEVEEPIDENYIFELVAQLLPE